jgi:hypothetical protein
MLTTPFVLTRSVGLSLEDLSPQGRAALTTYLLALRGEMTTSEIAESVGLGSGAAVRAMLANLSSAGVPVFQPQRGCWALFDEELARRFGQGSMPNNLM